MRIKLGLLLVLPFLLWPGFALALVNINTATLTELDTLPGVGPTIAQKIIDARPFSSTSGIQNVQGIGGPGSKTYDDIIGLITVGGNTTTPDTEEEQSEDKTEESKENSTVAEKKISSNSREPLPPVEGVTLTAPDHAFVGQVIEFSVEPNDDVKERLVRYLWNFGDTKTADTKSPTHSYDRPGTYLVVVESYYLKETKVVKKKITILPNQLSVVRDISGGVSVTNNSDYEMDLSGMTLGQDQPFRFPKHSLLLPGETVMIGADNIREPTTLWSAAGKLVASTVEAAETSGTPATVLVAAVAHSPASKREPELVVQREVAEQTGSDPVSLPTSEPSHKWPYLGLFGIIGLGLFAIYGTVRV